MASNYWMKLFYEVVDDPKMGRLPDNLWRRFFECCCLAGELDLDGRLPSLPDIAWRLHIDEEALRIEFDQMARIGLVDYVGKSLDEHWVVVNYAKRQSRMTSKERMQRKREYDKKQDYYKDSYEPVTIRNTDIDKDIDIDEDEDEDEDGGTAPFGKLLDAFCKNTGIPDIMFKSGDVAIIKRWVKAKYTPEEVEQAISEMQAKDLTIVGPKSIDSALKIVRSKNKVPQKQPNNEEAVYAAFLKGDE